MLELPADVEEIVALAGRVRVKTTPRVFKKQLTLLQGALSVPFTPVSDDVAALDQGPFHAFFPISEQNLLGQATKTDSGAHVSIETVCEGAVNAFPEWSLANSKTMHVRLFDRTQPVDLKLGGKLALRPHGQPLVFRAAIGAHRARAQLRVEITPVLGGESRSHVIDFDSTNPGGRLRSGYQDVTIEIPPSRQECVVSMGLRYLSYVKTEEDNDPFLFVANPEVMSPHGKHQVLVPHKVIGETVTGSSWYEAVLPKPALHGAGSIAVQAGSDLIPVLEPRKTTVELLENAGHSLHLTASRNAQYSFFLNGEAAFSGYIGTSPTDILVPSTYLTGGNHHLSIRDDSGTQVFLETYVLLPQSLTPNDVLQHVSKDPFPGAIFAQASHRYESLKRHLANPGSAEELRQASYALSVLEGGYENVSLEPLHFPDVANPDVSIIIPAHNKIAVTYYALCALLLARNTATFEVILVDDASDDETVQLESFVSGIKVIHNSEPQRFIRACNAGVSQARGNYVVLLNNDTEPTSGWLDSLIDAFSRFPDVGLVGSKLLYPNGRLQDAGGIIWGSGNPWNYGNQQNPWDPRYSYARQADYLSGAALMTTRKIWDEVGGLSSYLEPMYFEDTDFSFKVRDAGYATWFVPSSIVYHFEGMTSGTDVGSGFKQYQEVNRPKFKRRWAKAYANFGVEGTSPDLEKDRGVIGRVLFIDYTTPRPDYDAGSYAAIQEMKLVQSLGYKVTFFPQNLAHLGAYTHDLERDGIEVITAPFCLSLNDFLEKQAADFDVVYITRYYVGRDTIDKIRQVAPRAKILFNTADLHFLRQLRAARVNKDENALEEARKVRTEELAVIQKTDVVLSYNVVEESVIDVYTEGAVKVVKCPWVVHLSPSVPAFGPRKGISFLGGFNHHPNGEGLKWFAKDVMPLLEAHGRRGKKADDIVLSVYGSQMGDDIRALKSKNIDPIGYVKNLSDAYDRHRLFVAPLLSGAGIKGKVLGALAHGIPCVLSPVAAEGVGLRHNHDCLIAESPAEWAEAIVRAYGDQKFWQSLSTNARDYVESQYSFETGRKLMRKAFETVDMFGSFD